MGGYGISRGAERGRKREEGTRRRKAALTFLVPPQSPLLHDPFLKILNPQGREV